MRTLRPRLTPRAAGPALLAVLVLALAACGTARTGSPTTANASARSASASPGGSAPAAHPQVLEPNAGVQADVVSGPTPVGDVNAHAPSLATVKRQLRLELVAAAVTNATYIDPLRYVTRWERTDQGVDASMPVGAPILAPCTIKILAIIPGWYAGQPLVYFELLDGP
ncbi:MAG TPA: hypothetical protein VII87_12840, partial [Solirubrobacteraceae bacterium]